MISPRPRKIRDDASNQFAWRKTSPIHIVNDQKREADEPLMMMSPNRKRRKTSQQHLEFLISGIKNLNIHDPNSPTKRSRYGKAPTQSMPLQAEKLFREFLHEVSTDSAVYIHDGTVFHLFAGLPTEIRLEIWELARPDPQIVRLKLKKDGYNVYSTTPIPGIMQACKESRCYGFEKWYPLNQPCTLPNVTFYFNPEIDIMFRGCEECDSVANCVTCFSLWPYEVCNVAKRVMFRGKQSISTLVCRFLFSMIASRYPLIKDLMFLSPECTAACMSDIQLSMENLTESSYTFSWQNSQSILEISQALMSPYHHLFEHSKGYKKPVLEKASCMELAVTAQTSKLYGFLKTKFERMDIGDLLQRNIPSTRAMRNRHQKDLREAHRTKIRPIRKTATKSLKDAIEDNRRKRVRGVIRKQLECGPEFFTQLCNRAGKAAECITGTVYVGRNPSLHGVRIGGRPGVFTIGLLGFD